jgi:L-ascorbate metabolism protein UlaG (beta-lactamase superfamily)
MTITWLGHSCFLMEQDGYQIITDPYEGVEGYPPLRAEAHEVFCSHEHQDHNYRAGVTILPAAASPFAVKEIASFHDGEQGALRGTNTIRTFTAGGYTVCHLGDLGHLPTEEQLRAIGPVDVLLIPVGGFYTIGPREAAETVRRIDARCVVPMHYRHTPYGLPKVGGVKPFLEQFPADAVKQLDGPSFEVTDSLPAILVPAYRDLR